MNNPVAMTVRSRMVLAHTLAFGALLVGLSLLIYHSLRRAEVDRLDARLAEHAEQIRAELAEEVETPATFSVAVAAIRGSRPEGVTGAKIQLLDSAGQGLFAADPLPRRGAGAAFASALRGESVCETAPYGRQTWRCCWVPVEVHERVAYVALVAAPMDEALAALHRLRLVLLLGVPAALALAALAAYRASSAAFRPVAAMTTAAGNISASSLDSRIALPRAHDEIRGLAETFNAMLDRIAAAFASQRQFVADAAHELRTPQTVIHTELEYALRTVSDQAARESINVALAENDRLASLVEGLLLLARLDAGQATPAMQPVRLDEVVLESVHLLQPLAARKRIELRVDIDEAAEVMGDSDKLKRVFINVLDNAIKYSGDHCRVDVVMQSADQARNVCVRVSDTGTGIAAADLPHIFERFYRSSTIRRESGSGLGLAIARQLVLLHGGDIHAQSEPDKGTSVTVALPRLPA